MARLHPDILSGLLSLEPLSSRPGAAGIDPGQAGAFEQFLNQARCAAGEPDTAGSAPPQKPPSAGPPSPPTQQETSSASPAEASGSEAANPSRAENSAKPVAAEENDRFSHGSSDRPPTPGDAAQEPADKQKEGKRQRHEKPEHAAAVVVAGALPAASVVVAPHEDLGDGPNAAQQQTMAGAHKGQRRVASSEKAQGAANAPSDAQDEPPAGAGKPADAGADAVAQPSLKGRGQAAATIAAAEQARTEAGDRRSVQGSAGVTPGQQPAEALPETGTHPRRREARQTTKDAAGNRSPEASGGNPAGQGRAAEIDPPATAAAVEASVAAAAPVDVAVETSQSPNKAAPSPEGASHVDGSPRTATNGASRSAAGRPASATPGVSQADRVRFVERVARAFQSVGSRSGSIRLRLHPPELGSLRVEVTVRNGNMTARLEAETPEARTALLENLPALRERLAEQHIKVDRFDVDLADRSPGGLPQGPGGDSQSRDQGGRPTRSQGGFRQSETERTVEPRAAVRPGETSQLDVFI